MPEAVIVAATRTPIGRARKGSLVDARPDDLAAFAIDSALKHVPELDRAAIVDVMVGCGFPQEKQGMNLGRRAALLVRGLRRFPGYYEFLDTLTGPDEALTDTGEDDEDLGDETESADEEAVV